MEKYLFEQSLVLIPFLNVLGLIFKQIKQINDKYIPLILLLFGLIGSVFVNGFNIQSVIQGVLVTGAAVYSNQLVKQLNK